ncbi:MAG: VWA domain-containing protein [Myxococcales bacterium]|nr:MAG: VWA domain-containing protein [Myxococcales bacterium]
MEFSNPWAFIAAAPVLAYVAIEFVREKRRAAPLPFPTLPGRAAPPSLRSRFRRAPTLLRFVALALVVVALAGPRIPSDATPIHREGIDIVVAFDISTSMKALDFEPTDRFSVAKQTIGEFVKGRKNDRVGLVVFAGEAYTQCPLTLDAAVLLNILDAVKMDVIEDGTAIGDALAMAVNRLRDSEAKSKVVVLLTDGDNNRGSIAPEAAARLAKEFNVRVHTIQVGKGGRVPYPVRAFDFFSSSWVVQKQLAEAPVNPELLRRIADETGGRFFVAADSGTLKKIFDVIDAMEKTELPGEEFTLYKEAYSAFALPALLLLVLEILLRAFVIRKFP